MTQKIEGRFYPLQHDEWVKACQELTPAQRDVLYFIRTLDPYNNGLDINTAEIARQLSTETKKVHRQTVSRALKELDSRGFIDLELLMVKVAVKPKGLWCDDTPGCDDATVLSTDNERDHDATSVIMTQHARSLRNNLKPEALPNKGSKSLRSNKTYKDFIDSLSESEREKFFEFGLKKAAELPKAPTLPKKWVQQHFQELYSQFRQEFGEAISPSQNWENHPRRDEWLLEMLNLGTGAFIGLAPSQERSERLKFREWAKANNHI